MNKRVAGKARKGGSPAYDPASSEFQKSQLQRLEKVRQTLLDRIKVKDGVIPAEIRSSDDVLIAMRDGIDNALGSVDDTSQIDLRFLYACAVVLGRWPRPREVQVMLGDSSIRLYEATYMVHPLDSTDPPIRATEATATINAGFSRQPNARVSQLMGGALNYITRACGLLYVWFETDPELGTVCRMYAFSSSKADAEDRFDRASSLVNQTSRKYRPPKPQSDSESSSLDVGFGAEVYAARGLELRERLVTPVDFIP